MKECNVNDVVMIEWVDSTFIGGGGWIRPEEEDFELPHIFTVGHVIYINEEAIGLAASVSDKENSDVCGVMAIPKSAILSIKVFDEDN